MLTCTGCFLDKPDDDFPRNTKAVGRRQRGYRCRMCVSAWYDARRDTHRKQTRARHIFKRYGITAEEYDKLLQQPCAICGDDRNRRVLDHCHASGTNREPLCDHCNTALGQARDDPALLRAMADYLERHAAA